MLCTNVSNNPFATSVQDGYKNGLNVEADPFMNANEIPKQVFSGVCHLSDEKSHAKSTILLKTAIALWKYSIR